MVEAGIAAAGGLLVVGAVVGNGVAAAAMDMSDGQTWLGGDDGSIVQINPATGQPEYRLLIGGDGEQMEVTQSDGLLVVTNLETGVVTAIDLAGLVAGQGRQTDGETTVLVGGGYVMLAEMEPGFVQVVDPLTMAGLGAPYRAGEDLSDAVIDGDGTVWLMTDSGELRELDWVPESGEFSVSLQRPVAGAGPQTRLVPHSSGVTVFAPDGGAVLQIGVGADYVQQVPSLQGEVQGAKKSPADLAPASATEAGLVFMVSGQQLLTIDVAGIGCADPLRPAVLERHVYVPCGGEGRVIVLDENGRRASIPDIVVPGGGDPELTVDEGRLFVHDPEDGRIVIVQPDGSTTVTDANGAEVPTSEADEADPLPPVSTGTTTPPPPTGSTTPPVDIDPPLPPDPTDDATDGQIGGPTPGPTDLPTEDVTDDPTGGLIDDPTDRQTDGSTGGSSTDGTDGDEDLAPSDVVAAAQPDGSVEVSWTAAVVPPDRYVVTSSDGVTESVPSDRTNVTLTSLACGTSIRLTVYGQHGDQMVGAGTDVETAPCMSPPEPEDLTPRSVVAERADDDVVVGWTAPEIAPERYVVTGMGLTQTVDGAASSAVFTGVECGIIEVEVTAVHTDAGEYSASSSRTVETCQTPTPTPTPTPTTPTPTITTPTPTPTTTPPPTTTTPPTTTATLTAPTNVAAVHEGGGQVRVSWSPSSPAADEYVVTPSGGGGTVSTTGTQATLTVAEGASYTFTVEARWEGQSATSAASNSVNVPAPMTAPGAPTNVQGSYVSHSGTTSVTISVSWTAPDDGGSQITEYRVTPSGGSTVTVTGTSTQVTVPCSGSLCTTGGTVNVSVVAVNSVGESAAGSGSASIPRNDSIPQDGDAVLSAHITGDSETGRYHGTITYTPNAAWASWGGTCTLTTDRGTSQTIDCAQSVTVSAGSAPFMAGLDISGSVTITGNGITATSTASESAAGQPWCNPQTGECYQVYSLPLDPDVEIDDLPWVPPEPTDPPVLVAGIGLLLGAGTMRTLRVLRRRGLFETPAESTHHEKDQH